jgi:hypothetical protein
MTVADLDACKTFTPASLAAHWGEPWTEAMIRDRCREGRIPAKKVGKKLWIIPAAALAAWLADPSCPEPPRPKAPTQPYKIVVRKS